MPNIKHYLNINAPVEVVFKAITEQEGLSKWWTEETVASVKLNSVAEFKFGDLYQCKMNVSNLLPGKKVEWKCVDGADEWIGTSIVFEMEEDEGNTVLKFSHSGWKEETDFFARCNYNWAWYMTSLKNYCETGKGTPFQLRGE